MTDKKIRLVVVIYSELFWIKIIFQIESIVFWIVYNILNWNAA